MYSRGQRPKEYIKLHEGYKSLVSRGQTLFCTDGKGLGHGHRAVYRPAPAPWIAYQSQHSIQSHDTWSVWLTGKFKNFGLSRAWTWSVRSMPREKCLESWAETQWKSKLWMQKIASLTLAIAIADIMTGFTWLIKFLGNKLLYGHVLDPCGIGSGHARLTNHIHPRSHGTADSAPLIVNQVCVHSFEKDTTVAQQRSCTLGYIGLFQTLATATAGCIKWT